MSTTRRSVVPLIIAAVIGVVLIIGARALLGGGGGSSTCGNGRRPVTDRSTCLPVQVVASSEKAALLGDLADQYERPIRVSTIDA